MYGLRFVSGSEKLDVGEIFWSGGLLPYLIVTASKLYTTHFNEPFPYNLVADPGEAGSYLVERVAGAGYRVSALLYCLDVFRRGVYLVTGLDLDAIDRQVRSRLKLGTDRLDLDIARAVADEARELVGEHEVDIDAWFGALPQVEAEYDMQQVRPRA